MEHRAQTGCTLLGYPLTMFSVCVPTDLEGDQHNETPKPLRGKHKRNKGKRKNNTEGGGRKRTIEEEEEEKKEKIRSASLLRSGKTQKVD